MKKVYHTPETVDKSLTTYAQADCTIVALGNALDISYDLSKAIYQNIYVANNTLVKMSKKRSKNTFASSWNVYDIARMFVGGQLPIAPKAITVKKFIELNPEGRYFVIIPRHAFVINDGVLVDGSAEVRPYDYIIRAYEVDWGLVNRNLKKVTKILKMNLTEHFMLGALDKFIGANEGKTYSEMKSEAMRGSREKFVALAKKKKINVNLFGKTFDYMGETYEIVSVNPSRRSYLLSAIRHSDNRVFSMHNDILEGANIKIHNR